MFGAGRRMLLPFGKPNTATPMQKDAAQHTWRDADGAACPKMTGRHCCRPAVFRSFAPCVRAQPYLRQVEYLNSGNAFSSSLVALNTAWSGYQGFGLAAGAIGWLVAPAAPVVVVDAGRLPVAGAALELV